MPQPSHTLSSPSRGPKSSRSRLCSPFLVNGHWVTSLTSNPSSLLRGNIFLLHNDPFKLTGFQKHSTRTGRKFSFVVTNCYAQGARYPLLGLCNEEVKQVHGRKTSSRKDLKYKLIAVFIPQEYPASPSIQRLFLVSKLAYVWKWSERLLTHVRFLFTASEFSFYIDISTEVKLIQGSQKTGKGVERNKS